MTLFKKIKVIGAGTYGKAILVIDSNNNEYVMKVVELSDMSDSNRLASQKEAQILAEIGLHPFIVRYYKSFIHGTKLHIIMDFAKGGDLSDRINKQKQKQLPFNEKIILRWFTQASLAIEFLHSRFILHRDLKAQNMFLGKNDELLVGDFGIAKILDSSQAVLLTKIGTPYYLSPELCKGEAYSYPADIWALGCILYELATLSKPFDGNSLGELIEEIKFAEIQPIPSVYSQGLSQLIYMLLNRNQKERPTIHQILETPIVQSQLPKVLSEAKSFETSNPLKQLIKN